METGGIRWMYAFVDRPWARFDEAAAFWTAVTGTSLSARRGADGEFATLVPGGADACVKLQGVRDGTGGAHLDLAVEGTQELAERAVSLGAVVTFRDPADDGGLVVLTSPSGQAFCAVTWHGEARRPAVYGGMRLDQVSIDVAPEEYEAETAFWAGVTGWAPRSGRRPEFRALVPDEGLPIRILLQRLDEPREIGAHLDFACADREAARAAHEELGAAFVAEYEHWTVMRDPAGGVYCLTARDPETGRLG